MAVTRLSTTATPTRLYGVAGDDVFAAKPESGIVDTPADTGTNSGPRRKTGIGR